MRLDFGSSVRCSDAAFGELVDVVVTRSRAASPTSSSRRTHREQARLVAIERVRPADDGLALDHSIADVEALESLRETAYVRTGEQVVADPDWDVGTEDVLAVPLYQEMDGMGTVVDLDPHVLLSYDRIPKSEVEIRRSSAVISTDGHHLGHVEGFLIGSGDTADIVLERGISGGAARSSSPPL